MVPSEAVDVLSRPEPAAPGTLKGNRDYTVFTVGTALSNLARSAAFVIVTIIGYQQWHNAVLVGLIDTIEVVAYVAFALPAGWMADRRSRKGVRATGGLLGGLAYAVLTLFEAGGHAPVGLLIAVVVVAAIGLELVIASSRPALRQIVVQDDMMAAQSGNQGIGVASMMVGALAGGALWAVRPWVPPAFIAMCCLGTAATTVCIGRKLAAEHGDDPAGGPDGAASSMLSGLRFLLREPVLRAATVIGGLTEFAVGGYIITMIILMQQRGQSFVVVGGVLGACTLGMTVGAVLGSSLMAQLRLGTVTWVGLSVSCASFCLAGIVRQTAADFVFLFLACLIVAPLTSGFATYEALVVPLELQGRVTMSDRTVVNVAKALAPVAGGMLLSSLGGTTALELFGLCIGLAALYAVAYKRIRTVDVRMIDRGAAG